MWLKRFTRNVNHPLKSQKPRAALKTTPVHTETRVSMEDGKECVSHFTWRALSPSWLYRNYSAVTKFQSQSRSRQIEMSLHRSLSLSLSLATAKEESYQVQMHTKKWDTTLNMCQTLYFPHICRPARDPLLTLVHIFTLAKLDHFLPPSPKIVQTQNECVCVSGSIWCISYICPYIPTLPASIFLQQ